MLRSVAMTLGVMGSGIGICYGFLALDFCFIKSGMRNFGFVAGGAFVSCFAAAADVVGSTIGFLEDEPGLVV